MNNNKIILLIGASGSGKSTIETKFIENEGKDFGGFNHIVSHATRKIRKGEKDGEDYHFISEEEFDEIDKRGEFVQKVEHAGSRKGSALVEWKNKLEKGNIIVPILLTSALEVINNLPKLIPGIEKNIHIVFIKIGVEEAFYRMIGRYVLDINSSEEELIKEYKDYIQTPVEKRGAYEFKNYNVLREIESRLNDIELLKDTPKYTDNILNVDGKSKETVYNHFIHIMDNIMI